jgi:protein-tyrosine-phosphatase
MQVECRRSDLSIDQQLALKTAASNLAQEFDGAFGAETIDRFLHSSYDEQHLAGGRAVAWSCGSEPATTINTSAITAMRERGIDISGEYPKPWTDEVVRAADVVVTMGCGDACPVFPGRRYEDWVLDDPAGLEVADVRPIRDEIERRVHRLLAELDVPAHV